MESSTDLVYIMLVQTLRICAPFIVLNEEVLVVAEGKGVRQYPRGVPREGPVSAHRGTGGESLFY